MVVSLLPHTRTFACENVLFAHTHTHTHTCQDIWIVTFTYIVRIRVVYDYGGVAARPRQIRHTQMGKNKTAVSSVPIYIGIVLFECERVRFVGCISWLCDSFVGLFARARVCVWLPCSKYQFYQHNNFHFADDSIIQFVHHMKNDKRNSYDWNKKNSFKCIRSKQIANFLLYWVYDDEWFDSFHTKQYETNRAYTIIVGSPTVLCMYNCRCINCFCYTSFQCLVYWWHLVCEFVVYILLLLLSLLKHLNLKRIVLKKTMLSKWYKYFDDSLKIKPIVRCNSIFDLTSQP